MRANYDYDAWGNHTVTGAQRMLGEMNPFRYRGYYYDTETKLYYLQTRYYDPETGRFLNMDSIDYADPENLNGLNLYAYCNNNPVMYVDPTGHFSFWSFMKVVVSVLAVAALAALATTVGGPAGMILAGAALGGAIGAVAGAATGAIGAAITGEDVFDGMADGMLLGTATGMLKGAFNSAIPGGGLVGELAIANVMQLAISAGGAAVSSVGSLYVLSTTGKSGGYWGQKYSNDHLPEHVHLLGNDGTNIRIGVDGKPLPGEPPLKAQQRKALKRLLNELLALFR